MSLLNCSVMLLFCNLCACSWNCTTKQESPRPKIFKDVLEGCECERVCGLSKPASWAADVGAVRDLLCEQRPTTGVETSGGWWREPRWRMGWEDPATEAGNHGPSYVPEDIFWGYLNFGILAFFPECSVLMIEIIEDNKTGHKRSAFRSLFSPVKGNGFRIHEGRSFLLVTYKM